MLSQFLHRARRTSILVATALATGVCILAPAATSAHGRAHLKSATTGSDSSQESATGAIAEAPSTPTAESTTTPPTDSPSTAPSNTESNTAASGRERRARRDDQAPTDCTITLATSTSTIAPSAPLGLSGTFSCTEAAGAGEQTVSLYQKAAHTTGFSVAATTSTEANGAFQFALTGPESNSAFYVLCDGVKSLRTSVEVAPQVTIEAPTAGAPLLAGTAHAPAESAADGTSAVTFTGTVTPADPGATVTLQREYRPGAWHRIAGGQVEEAGKYTIVHTFLRPGEANIRVVVHSRGLYAETASAPVSYQITRQRKGA